MIRHTHTRSMYIKSGTFQPYWLAAKHREIPGSPAGLHGWSCKHSCRLLGASAASSTAFPGMRNVDYLNGFDEEGETYYDILGVDPASDKRSVRKAYHNAMRDCHPDSSNAEEGTEFATFLNEIYETLMDEEKRAEYDTLIGFSQTAVNPFKDPTFEKDQVFVDEITCIGCTNCVGVCPETFQMQWDEHGRARVIKQNVDSYEDLQEAIDTCPVNCIHRVTAPQLTLLETVMRKMDRIDAWIMNSGGGHGVHVFVEASIAWEKRQSKIRARENHERQKAIWQMWEPAGASSAGRKPSFEETRATKQRHRSVETAERAAKAARRWRDYQRKKGEKAMLQLAAPSRDS